MILKKWTKIAAVRYVMLAIVFIAAAFMVAATNNSKTPQPDLQVTVLSAVTEQPQQQTRPEARPAATANTMPKTEAATETTATKSDFVYMPQLELSEELQRYTYEKCMEEKIDYTLVLALMWRESRFKVDAVGYNSNGTKDNGLMQINDVNRAWLARDHGINDLLDPHQNIAAGTGILGQLTDRHGMHNALMAYQYGESGMKRRLAQGITTNKLIEALYLKKAELDELLLITKEVL